MMCSNHQIPALKFHSGIALLAGLLLLAAISLLALTSTSSMILQQGMAANFDDDQRARRGAIEAVSQGESFLMAMSHEQRTADCVDQCYASPLNNIIHQAAELPANPEYQTSEWWTSSALQAGIDPMTGLPSHESWGFSAQAPRFLIEELYFDDGEESLLPPGAPTVDGIAYYRILGRGTGRGSAAVAVSESIMARPWLGHFELDPVPMEGDRFCAAFEAWYHCGRMTWRERR